MLELRSRYESEDCSSLISDEDQTSTIRITRDEYKETFNRSTLNEVVWLLLQFVFGGEHRHAIDLTHHLRIFSSHLRIFSSHLRHQPPLQFQRL